MPQENEQENHLHESDIPVEMSDIPVETNEETENQTVEAATPETPSADAQIAELKDKYLRLYADFENFRRRTAKEKTDLLQTAESNAIAAILPVVDDFERALKAMEKAQDIEAVKEGVQLIYHKLFKTLEQRGLIPMKSVGEVFNVETHEAITQIPAPTEDLKGKVVDEVERGYYLKDKIIRFAKVIVGN